MLVGEPPYPGTTTQAVLGKIIAGKPVSAREHRSAVPANVDAAIRCAIEKLPADRFSSAQEFVRALGDEHFRYGELAAAGAAVGPWHPRSIAMVGLVSLAALAGGVAIGRGLEPSSVSEIVRFELPRSDVGIVPSESGLFREGPSVALSPDGSQLVYVGLGDDGRQLYSRQLDQLASRAIPGTQGASPFFSPDGRSIGFIAIDRSTVNGVRTAGVRIVSVDGGPRTEITDSAYWGSADWGTDGFIYFTHARTQGIARVPEDGGTIQFLTEPDTVRGELRHQWPDALPGGQGALFTIRRANLDASDLAGVSFGDGQVRILTNGVYARHMPTGHLLYVTANGNLLAVPFDDSSLELTGGPVAMAAGLEVGQYRSPAVSFSDSGTLTYLTGSSTTGQELVWIERDGTEEPSNAFEPSDFEDLALSPDGLRVAITVEVEEGRVGTQRRIDVYVVDLQQGRTHRLTSSGSNERPFWTADGQHVAFLSLTEGKWDFYWRAWDASAPVDLLFSPPHDALQGTFDGESLLYTELNPETGMDIQYVELGDSDSQPMTLLGSEYAERSPMVSPSGRLLAFVSDESGRDEVYVMSLQDPEDTRRVSPDGGTEPRWARNGRELFFRSDTRLVAAQIQTVPELSVVALDSLFAQPPGLYERSGNHTTYDIDSDDTHFLLIRQRDPETEQLIVVLNCFEELRQRMGN